MCEGVQLTSSFSPKWPHSSWKVPGKFYDVDLIVCSCFSFALRKHLGFLLLLLHPAVGIPLGVLGGQVHQCYLTSAFSKFTSIESAPPFTDSADLISQSDIISNKTLLHRAHGFMSVCRSSHFAVPTFWPVGSAPCFAIVHIWACLSRSAISNSNCLLF